MMNKGLKERHLIEIKTLENEYTSNFNSIGVLHERQKDIMSRMQIILNKLKKT